MAASVSRPWARSRFRRTAPLSVIPAQAGIRVVGVVCLGSECPAAQRRLGEPSGCCGAPANAGDRLGSCRRRNDEREGCRNDGGSAGSCLRRNDEREGRRNDGGSAGSCLRRNDGGSAEVWESAGSCLRRNDEREGRRNDGGSAEVWERSGSCLRRNDGWGPEESSLIFPPLHKPARRLLCCGARKEVMHVGT